MKNNLVNIFQDTADSIRTRSGSIEKIAASTFSNKIENLDTFRDKVNIFIGRDSMGGIDNFYFYKNYTYLKSLKDDYQNWSDGYKEYSFDITGWLYNRDSEGNNTETGYSLEIVEDNYKIEIAITKGGNEKFAEYNISLKDISNEIVSFNNIEKINIELLNQFLDIEETDTYIKFNIKQGIYYDCHCNGDCSVSNHLYKKLISISELN